MPALCVRWRTLGMNFTDEYRHGLSRRLFLKIQMRILVTFAVEAEFAPWRKRQKFARFAKSSATESAGLSAFHATMVDHCVEIMLTGIGRSSSKQLFAEDAILAGEPPDMVISSGFAGALRDGLSPGDIVAPRKIRALADGTSVAADQNLLEKAIEAGAESIETLITADRIVPTAAEKRPLALFGEAVDMESAIVLAYFAKLGIPALAIRAISDAANEDLPLDFERCLTPEGALKPVNLLRQIVKRPGNLLNLIRFGRQSTHVAERLAEFLDKFVAALPLAIEKVVKV